MSASSDNTTPMVSTKRELRKLSANTQATAAELKAFLAELKGRSPQEMLGIVASSQLIRSLALSAILVFALILVFTLIPYFRDDGKTGTTATTTEDKVTQAAAVPTQAKPETPKPSDSTPPEGTITQPDVSPLGVNEEKTAPPNVNPLEGNTDNFLNGLE